MIDSPDAPGDFGANVMKLSMILPIFKESHRLPQALSDLQSFFARLPLEIDLIIVCEPGEKRDVETQLAALPVTPRPLTARVLENSRRLGRGPSLQKGLAVAEGDILATLSADLNVPLAEIFAAIQEFLRDPGGTEFVLGNRRSLKRPRHGARPPGKKIFDDIEHDKAKGLEVPDPTSPFWVIRRDTWQKVAPNLKLRRWYYTPQLVRELRTVKSSIKSLDINSHDDTDTRFRWWHSVFQ